VVYPRVLFRTYIGLLFVMYIKTTFLKFFLSSAVIHQLFADDLKLYSTVKTSANAASLQSTLDRLQQCGINWQGRPVHVKRDA
jgi:hypothetical protein